MFRNYLKIAWRNLLRHRLNTLLNGTGLTVGLAGGILLFLFVRFHYQTDRHHPDADRIYRAVLDLHLDDGLVESSASAALPMVKALQADYPALEQVGFTREFATATLSVPNSAQRYREEETFVCANPAFFQIFPHDWLLGNAATALNAPNTVVLTARYARKYFGTAQAVGKTLLLDNKIPLRVTGVLADYTARTDLQHEGFVSLATLPQIDSRFDPTDMTWLSSRHQLYAKVRAGVPANSLAEQWVRFSEKYYGEQAGIYQLHWQPLREVHFDARYGGTISERLVEVLALIGLFLVGIACVNFVNLATAQAFLRAREVGVRQVLGSTRRQLFIQFMLETALLVGTAGLFAMALVGLLLPVFNRWLNTALSLRLWSDGEFWVFWLGLLAGTLVLAGGYPAFVLSRLRPVDTLKAARFSGGNRSGTVRKALVVGQFVIAQVLIISTIVVTRQLRLFQTGNLGFDQSTIVSFQLPDTSPGLRNTLRNELLRLPGVRQATAQFRPVASTSFIGGSLRFNNRAEWEKFPVRAKWGDAHFLETYGLTLVAGRNFTERDSLPEMVVNETFYEKLGFQRPEQVLGKAVEDGTSGAKGRIVGVVKDFHFRSLHEAIEPSVLYYSPENMQQMGVKLQTANLQTTLKQIGALWQTLLPQEVFEYKFLDEQIAQFYEKERLLDRLINLFSGVAILITCLGLFGLTSFTAASRTKEIGVRKVLGASVFSLVTLLSKDFLKLVLIAIIIASPVAYYAMHRWLADFAYRIDIAWWIFALAGLLAVGIALLTVSFQSIRAALMNPVKSLRSE